MPIFAFKCQDCGHKFDVMISKQHKDKVSCKECGSREVNSSYPYSQLLELDQLPANT